MLAKQQRWCTAVLWEWRSAIKDHPQVDVKQLAQRWYREGWFSTHTCIDALQRGAVEHGDSTVVFASEAASVSLTVGELHDRARTVAAGLQRRGIRPGDAVAVQLPTILECALAYQAALLAGAVLVPIVHIYGTAEVEFILAESRSKLLFVPDRLGSTDFAARAGHFNHLPDLEDVIVVPTAAPPRREETLWDELNRASAPYHPPAVDPDDVCAVIYTSGTASAPKGVQHTHNSVLAEQATQPAILAERSDDVQLVVFPPGHVAGMHSLLRPMLSGSACVFLDRWHPEHAVSLIERFGVTAMAGAPVHLSALLDVPDARSRLSSLRQFLTGAASITDQLGRRASDAGVRAFRCYGLTEHPTVTVGAAHEDERARMSTDGLPIGGAEIRVLDAEGRDCATGTEGEVVVRGPDQFVGYRDPSLNDGAFTDDAWFRTGDLGHLDAEGRLTITDRLKDVIIRGGETISSGQVEDALHSHPAIIEAAAIAAPDDRYGEVVAAVVVPADGADLDLTAVQAHFAAVGLARQKTPERLVLVDSLPRTAMGKVRKAELRRTHFADRSSRDDSSRTRG